MYCFKPKADYSRLDFMLYYCGTSQIEKHQSWGPGIRDYYSLYYITEGSGHLNIDGQSYTLVEETCFEYILESGNHPKSADLQAISGFYSLLGALCDHSSPQLPKIKSSNRQLDYIREAIEYIETNYSRPITIEEISNHVGINRKYLTKLFNEIMDNSPKNYLIHYRIDKACQLLNQSTLSIKEISHSVGYTDALVFSKIFKKVMGTCPRKYRNSHLTT